MEFIWEQIDEFIEASGIENFSAGPLHQPIKELRIKRRDDYSLGLTTTCDAGAQSEREEVPAGTVYDNKSSVEFDNKICDVKCIGIGSNTVNIKDPPGELYERSSFNRLIIEPKQKYAIDYTIEFVLTNRSAFIWPDGSIIEKSGSSKLRIGGDKEFEVEKSSSFKNFGRDSILLDIGGMKVALYNTSISSKTEGPEKLLIFFEGSIEKNIRNKVRDIVGYLLGQPLIYIGEAEADKTLKISKQVLISPYTVNGAVFNIPSLPPAPLGTKSTDGFSNMLDSALFNECVNSLYNQYDEIKFKHLYWLYWRARCLPFDISIVFYSAAIEALERAFFENNKELRNSGLLPKAEFKKLKNSLLDTLGESNIADKLKDLLKRKIENLNSLPKSILTERFFSTIGITLGKLEQEAWKRRNDSAHGNQVDDEDVIEYIRANKLVKGILDRAVLSIMNTQEFYFDYYSIGHPLRYLPDVPE